MRLDEALEVIYKSYNSLDELINPFKLKSRLADLCNDSFENKRLSKIYIAIMERINLMNYLLNFSRNEMLYRLKNSFELIKDIDLEDYRVCCLATIHLRYSTDDISMANNSYYRSIPGQLLYYSKEDDGVYHVSPSCTSLANAQNIMYMVCMKEEEISICPRCMDLKRKTTENIRLKPIDRMYAWANFGRKEKDIFIRKNGKNLSKREIKNEILKREG